MATGKAVPLEETEDDMIKLGELNDKTVLENLRHRYLADSIYTSVGDILVTVNPFKLLALYTPEVVEQYLEGGEELPPHVFKVADLAYKQMRDLHQNQALIIAGDSGAGKTETAKLVMNFLVESSSRACGSNEEADAKSAELAEKLLLANKVLEAFGNAKTSRNNNSSRFGKWTEIVFDANGQIVGGKVVQYLLEKTRVCGQAKGERNYHIFYQLLANADTYPELKLKEAKDYHYLNQSGVTTIENVDDKENFEELLDAMSKLGFEEKHLVAIRRVLAGLLLLGNLDIVVEEKANEENGSKITNMDVLEEAAALMEIDADGLHKTLLTKQLGTFTVILIGRSQEEAKKARDAFVQSIYSKLFSWLIGQMNIQLCHKADGNQTYQTIGVLDIFGFECFQENSFEQLCINYCNEKLQKHFTQQIVQVELEEYKNEGIPFAEIKYKDNSVTLQLLEGKPTGIMPMIQEEMNSPGATNERLLDKLSGQHKSHERFIRAPKDFDQFGVKHYAGDVKYKIAQFVEKNTDDAPALNTSSGEFMEDLFAMDMPGVDSPSAPSGGGRAARVTRNVKKALGVKFQGELATLLEKINSSSAHFVRCIKPNLQGKPDLIDDDLVASQLAACGIIDCIKVRASGYVGKYVKDDFVNRFACVLFLCPGVKQLKVSSTPVGKLLELMGTAVPDTGITKGAALLPADTWAEGTTKVFLRQEVSSWMAVCRRVARDRACVEIQKNARGIGARADMVHYKQVLQLLQTVGKSEDKNAIQEALKDAHETLPDGVVHMKQYTDAEAKLDFLIRQEQEIARLQEALDATSATPTDAHTAGINCKRLQDAVASATAFGMDASHPMLVKCQEQLMESTKEQEALVSITTAIASGTVTRAELDAVMGTAEQLGLSACAELASANNVITLMEKVDGACASKDGDQIMNVLSEVEAAGVKFASLAQAQETLKLVMTHMESVKQLQSAASSRNMDVIKSAIASAEAQGLEDVHPQALAHARQVLAELEHQMKVERQLLQCMSNRDMAALEACLKEAEKVGVNQEVMKNASNLVEILQHERTALDRLSKATLASTVESLSELTEALTQATSLSLDDAVECADAKARIKVLEAEKEELASKQESIDGVLADLAALNIAEHSSKLSIDENKILQDCLKQAERLGMSSMAAVVMAKQTALQLEEVCADPTSSWQHYPGMRSQTSLSGGKKKLRKMLTSKATQESAERKASLERNARQVKPRSADADDEIEELTFSKKPLKKALTQLPNIHVSSALAINRSILVFMGDRVHAYPSTAAVDLLKFGVRSLLLANETYIQLMRQLTNNPNPMSERNGWKLLCICARSFSPSEDLLPYVTAYVENKTHPDETGLLGATGLLAKSALRSLTTAESRGKVLKLSEIDAWRRMLWNMDGEEP